MALEPGYDSRFRERTSREPSVKAISGVSRIDESASAVAPAAALCDLVTVARLAGEPLPVDVSRWEDIRDRHRPRRRHYWHRVPEPPPRLPTA